MGPSSSQARPALRSRATRAHFAIVALGAALGGCTESTPAADAGTKPPGGDVTAVDLVAPDVQSVDAVSNDLGAPTEDLGAPTEDLGAPVDAVRADIPVDAPATVVSQEILPSGGAMSAPDLRLLVPAGALVTPQTITITARPSAGGGYRYEFGPAGLTFAIAAQVTVTLPSGTGPVRPVLSTLDGQGFTGVGSSRQGDELTMRITHFSNLCVRDGCPDPTMVRCGSALVDIGTSNDHCGGCDRPCPLGTRCETMTCAGVPSTPSATLMDLDAGVDRYAQQRSCQVAPGQQPPAGCGLQPVTGGALALVPGPGSRRFEVGTPPTLLYETALRGNVVVPGFTMDRYEVTVGRFRRFWNSRASWSADGRTVPYPAGKTFYYRYPSYFTGNQRIAEFWSAPREPERACAETADGGCPQSCNWTAAPGDREDHPINCVDWFTMLQFCMWDAGDNPTGRLPTEFELQYAAQGPLNQRLAAGRRWPWGVDAPTCGRSDATGANLSNCFSDRPDATRTYDAGLRQPRTVPVGSYVPLGLEPPFFDLVGNVREWTADVIQWVPFNPAPGPACLIGDFNRYFPGVEPALQCFVENFTSSVIRGSSFDDVYTPSVPAATDITVRLNADRRTRFAAIGARCARGPLAECGNAAQPCCMTPMGGICAPSLRCDTTLRDPICTSP